ncbi:MAG: SDR family oxidoreductase [Flavipsychrobacter sp.]|nr:SDR family oxidoreductase [Flavipsychrobacter sp.]
MPYAVVTGASQGIGQAIAEMLLSKGFSVAVCARSEAKLATTVAGWRQQYPNAEIIAVNADLGSKSGTDVLAAEVNKSFPKVDLLVNNAGTYQPGNVSDEPDGQLERMIQVNLYSAYNLTRSLLSMMGSGGHIFNMCSVASLKAYPGGGSYSISKYALLGFTDNLREELREPGIKVTAICPGAVWSPSWEGSGVSPERIMEANDIADTIWSAYILSPRAVTETIVMRPVKGDL